MSTPHDSFHDTPPVTPPDPGVADAAARRAQPWPPDLRLLRRSSEDHKVAGVCGGAGRWLGIDPLLLRVLIVLLALWGGSGLLIYGTAWLLVPQEGEAESHGQRLLRREVSTGTVGAVAVTLSGTGFIGQSIGGGRPSGLMLLALLAAGIVLAVRHGSPQGRLTATPAVPPPVPPPGPGVATGPLDGPASPAQGATPRPAGAPFAPHGPYGGAGPRLRPAEPPRRREQRPRRERSHLGLLTLSVLLLSVGTAAGIMTASGSRVDLAVLLGVALAVVGLGLLVGTVAGRARGLIPLGLLLSLVLAATTVAHALLPPGGVGQQTWTPRSATELRTLGPFEMGAGDVVLDLRQLPRTATALPDTSVELGVGQLTVLLPSDLDVTLRARAKVGEILLPDGSAPSSGAGHDVRTDLSDDIAGGPEMKLDLSVGFGQIEVWR